MTQAERREYLIRQLLDENPQYQSIAMPQDEQDQQILLRSLMNIRTPKPISSSFLRVQDEYLSAERDRRGIMDASSLSRAAADSRLSLWQGDITTLQCDAIVNAANSGMCGCFQPMHSCIDNIIHTRAGISLRLQCHEIMQEQGYPEPVGRAKLTPAYNLPCRYILHTVGPTIETGRPSRRQCAQLASCYRSCLELAAQAGCKSIAFCCISTGVFRFPQPQAAEIAVQTVLEFLAVHSGITHVIFNVFKDSDKAIYEKLLEVPS